MSTELIDEILEEITASSVDAQKQYCELVVEIARGNRKPTKAELISITESAGKTLLELRKDISTQEQKTRVLEQLKECRDNRQRLQEIYQELAGYDAQIEAFRRELDEKKQPLIEERERLLYPLNFEGDLKRQLASLRWPEQEKELQRLRDKAERLGHEVMNVARQLQSMEAVRWTSEQEGATNLFNAKAYQSLKQHHRDVTKQADEATKELNDFTQLIDG